MIFPHLNKFEETLRTMHSLAWQRAKTDGERSVNHAIVTTRIKATPTGYGLLKFEPTMPRRTTLSSWDSRAPNTAAWRKGSEKRW